MKKLTISSSISFQKLMILILTISYSIFYTSAFCQGVGINISNSPPDANTILDIDAKGMSMKAGILIPRMTTIDRGTIATPIPESLLIYNTDNHCFEAYYNNAWVDFGCLAGCPYPSQPDNIAGMSSVCKGQNNVSYSITNVPGLTYVWTYTGTGFTIASGSGTNSIIANFSATATSGTLSVAGSNFCGSGPASTLNITVNSSSSLSAPKAGTNIPTQTQIVWNWNTVNGAAGYQWNTSSSYPGAGINTLSGSTYTQTGLVCNTSDTIYVWAYNGCGNYSVTRLTQTTSCCLVSCAGSGTIMTVAGDGGRGYAGRDGDGGQAQCAQLYYPTGVAVDNAGNVYVIDEVINQIRKVTVSTGIIDNIAGNGSNGFTGDGGPASNAEFNNPNCIAVDGSGNVYISDGNNYRIRMINISTGIINTIAGNGTAGYTGNGGPATNAEIHQADGIAIDGSGNVFISDATNDVIRKITKTTGIISVYAGNGTAGFTGDGGQATNAELRNPAGLAIDASGNLYIADNGNNRIRKITASTGIIRTIAGNGTAGFLGDGGQATQARLSSPRSVSLDCSGNVYIADYNNDRIRKVTVSTGIITTIAGNGNSGNTGDGGPATSAEIQAESIAADCTGNVYFTYWTQPVVRKVCK